MLNSPPGPQTAKTSKLPPVAMVFCERDGPLWMHSQKNSSIKGNSSGGLWHALNAEAITTTGDLDDLIGLDDVVGFDAVTLRDHNNPQIRSTQLSQNEIDGWIERPCGDEDNGERLSGKVLIGNQVQHQDGLQPPVNAEAVRFSRKRLCDRFGLPPLVVKRLSHPSSWYLTFPGFHRSCWRFCEGLGASRFGFAMCSDNEKQTFSVLIIFYRAVKLEDRLRLQRDLEALSYLARDLSFLPYLILQLIIGIESFHLAENDRNARRADQEILRQANMGSHVRAIHTRAHQLAAVGIDASNGLKLAKRWSNLAEVNGRRLELQQGVAFSTQALENIVETAERSRPTGS